MKRMLLGLACVHIVVAPILFSQTREEVRTIYNNIEYNTAGYEDIQPTWVVLDPNLVREIYVKLMNKNAFKVGDARPSADLMKKRLEELQEGKVGVVCKQRYYDDQLEKLQFVSFGDSTPVFDAIQDYVYMKDVLGEVYGTIQKKDYPHKDVTKGLYDSRQRYYYDLNFNLLNPEIMFWSTTTSAFQRNRWLLSIFGRFGNDDIDLPFWFKGTVIAGLKITYLSNVELNDREYSKSSIYLGWEEPISFSIGTASGRFVRQVFKSPLLFGSGSNLFSRLTISSDYDYTGWARYRMLGVEGSFAVIDKDQMPVSTPDPFYSIRNTITASYDIRHASIAGSSNLFDFGGGISWHDLHRYSRMTGQLKEIESKKDNIIPYVEAGISQDGDLLHYSIGGEFNLNVSEGYGFFVFKSFLVLSNTIGIDFRYFKALDSSKLTPWQYDNYVVFSPIIRINY